MKYPKDQLDILQDGVVQFLASRNVTVDEVWASYAGCPPMRVMQDIFRHVSYDLQYDDSHPA